MDQRFGSRLGRRLATGDTVPFIGVYDVFSASLAARHFEGLFVSGFGFAASHYGLPDIGFIAWSDIVAFVQRLRAVVPDHHIIVDIDDGYCDTEVACHVVSLLERAGASGVILEDQQRPRRCGHYDGKQLLDLDAFRVKLSRVLETRRDLLVVARTDASDPADIERRVSAFAEAGADAILVDAVPSLSQLTAISQLVDRPLAFNQIAGGKSPRCTLQELHSAGVSIAIYSTPCLFAAQRAIVDAMESLQAHDGLLVPMGERDVTVKTCTAVLNDNVGRRTNVYPQSVAARSAAPAGAPPCGRHAVGR